MTKTLSKQAMNALVQRIVFRSVTKSIPVINTKSRLHCPIRGFLFVLIFASLLFSSLICSRSLHSFCRVFKFRWKYETQSVFDATRCGTSRYRSDTKWVCIPLWSVNVSPVLCVMRLDITDVNWRLGWTSLQYHGKNYLETFPEKMLYSALWQIKSTQKF